MAIGLSVNGCSHSENQFDDRIESKMEYSQSLDFSDFKSLTQFRQPNPSFLCLTQQDKSPEVLLAECTTSCWHLVKYTCTMLWSIMMKISLGKKRKWQREGEWSAWYDHITAVAALTKPNFNWIISTWRSYLFLIFFFFFTLSWLFYCEKISK